MKTRTFILNRIALGLLLFLAPPILRAGVQRIADGGLALDLTTILPTGQTAVLVFHATWHQPSRVALERIEARASEHPEITFIFVDCVDVRTRVARQFSLRRLPAIMIYNREGQPAGGPLHDPDALFTALEAAP